MSAIVQLKKDIQLLKSQLDEVKKLNEYIKINSTEIDNIKKDFNIINKELRTIIHSNNLLHSKEIKELKTIIHSNKLINDEKLEVNKAIHNKDIKELKEEIIKLKSISPKDNNKIEKDIFEIKKFIKISMGEKFKFSDGGHNIHFFVKIGDFHHKNFTIDKKNLPLYYYLNQDLMDDYVNDFWNYYKNDKDYMGVRHQGDYVNRVFDGTYLIKNPINWKYIKNYYKLEI